MDEKCDICGEPATKYMHAVNAHYCDEHHESVNRMIQSTFKAKDVIVAINKRKMSIFVGYYVSEKKRKLNLQHPVNIFRKNQFNKLFTEKFDEKSIYKDDFLVLKICR